MNTDEKTEGLEYVEFNRLLSKVGLMIEDLMSFDEVAQANMRIALDNLKDIYQTAVNSTHE